MVERKKTGMLKARKAFTYVALCVSLLFTSLTCLYHITDGSSARVLQKVICFSATWSGAMHAIEEPA